MLILKVLYNFLRYIYIYILFNDIFKYLTEFLCNLYYIFIEKSNISLNCCKLNIFIYVLISTINFSKLLYKYFYISKKSISFNRLEIFIHI